MQRSTKLSNMDSNHQIVKKVGNEISFPIALVYETNYPSLLFQSWKISDRLIVESLIFYSNQNLSDEDTVSCLYLARKFISDGGIHQPLRDKQYLDPQYRQVIINAGTNYAALDEFDQENEQNREEGFLLKIIIGGLID